MRQKTLQVLGLSTREKRAFVTMVHEQEGYPIVSLCRVLVLPRSSHYYRPVVKDESQLRAAIESIAGRFPTYGSRRITQQLRRLPYAWLVNRKRIQRLMRHMGLQRPLKRRRYAPRTASTAFVHADTGGAPTNAQPGGHRRHRHAIAEPAPNTSPPCR